MNDEAKPLAVGDTVVLGNNIGHYVAGKQVAIVSIDDATGMVHAAGEGPSVGRLWLKPDQIASNYTKGWGPDVERFTAALDAVYVASQDDDSGADWPVDRSAYVRLVAAALEAAGVAFAVPERVEE